MIIMWKTSWGLPQWEIHDIPTSPKIMFDALKVALFLLKSGTFSRLISPHGKETKLSPSQKLSHLWMWIVLEATIDTTQCKTIVVYRTSNRRLGIEIDQWLAIPKNHNLCHLRSYNVVENNNAPFQDERVFLFFLFFLRFTRRGLDKRSTFLGFPRILYQSNSHLIPPTCLKQWDFRARIIQMLLISCGNLPQLKQIRSLHSLAREEISIGLSPNNKILQLSIGCLGAEVLGCYLHVYLSCLHS